MHETENRWLVGLSKGRLLDCSNHSFNEQLFIVPDATLGRKTSEWKGSHIPKSAWLPYPTLERQTASFKSKPLGRGEV